MYVIYIFIYFFFLDFDFCSKLYLVNFMICFVFNNMGLLCFFGIFVLLIFLGFVIGYFLVVLGVSVYKKIIGEKLCVYVVKEVL